MYEQLRGAKPGDFRYRFEGVWLARDKTPLHYGMTPEKNVAIEVWPKGAMVPKYPSK